MVDPALQILAQKEMPGRARAILPSCPAQRTDEIRSTLQATLGWQYGRHGCDLQHVVGGITLKELNIILPSIHW